MSEKMKILKKTLVVILVLALLIGAVAGGMVVYRNASRKPVNVYSATDFIFSDYWGDENVSYGMVEAEGMQQVSITSTQKVKEIYVQPGQEVKAGDALLSYDTTLSSLDLQRAEIAVQKLELDLTNAKADLRKANNLTAYADIPGFREEAAMVLFASASQNRTDLPFRRYLAKNDPEQLNPDGNETSAGTEDHGKENEKQPENPTTPSQEAEHTPASSTENVIRNTEEVPATEKTTEQVTVTETETVATSEQIPAGNETEQTTTGQETEISKISEGRFLRTDSDHNGASKQNAYCYDITSPTWQFSQHTLELLYLGQKEIPGRKDATADGLKEGTKYLLLTSEKNVWGMELVCKIKNQIPVVSIERFYSPNEEDVTEETTEETTEGTTEETTEGTTEETSEESTEETSEETTEETSEETTEETSEESTEETTEEFIDDPGYFGGGGSGYTWSEIAQMRNEAERRVRDLELELEIARLDLEIKQKEFDNGTIYARVDGVIKEVRDPEDAYINSEPVVEVSGGGGFYIKGSISEMKLGQITIGQSVTISSWSSGAYCEGQIVEISDIPTDDGTFSMSDGGNVSYYPFTVFVDGDQGLKEYEYVEMTYSSQADSNAWYLQNMFIRSENGQNYVMVMGEDGKLEKRKVTLGKILWDSYTQIRDGLTSDDYIAFPYGDAVEGAKTRIADSQELYQ